jgi:hypothetical protein
VGVSLGRLAQPGLGGELGVETREVGIGEVTGLPRIRDVELDVTAVPVRDEHDLARADPLHDDVVVEHVGEVRRSRLHDPLESLPEVVLRDEHGLPRVADVRDVDVARLAVVDEDRVCPASGIPREDAVNLVRRGLLRLAGARAVAEALDQCPRPPRVRDVVQVQPARAPLAVARLVVGHHDVAIERRRVDVQRLDAFARIAPVRSRDEPGLARPGGIAEVDDVDPVVLARAAAPGAEIGVPAEEGDVGDALPRGALQLEGRDELDVRAGRPEMPAGPGVLVSVVLDDGRYVEYGALRRGARSRVLTAERDDSADRGHHDGKAQRQQHAGSSGHVRVEVTSSSRRRAGPSAPVRA